MTRRREFAAAAFARMRVADEAILAHGIFWPEPCPSRWSRMRDADMFARAYF
jgi:hypothetical protein